jgi:hypothetical protein
MAGPTTRSFVEALEFTLAHEIVQLARNLPKHLVIYTYTQGPNAVPLVMISKYESDMTDDQFKVRVWDADIMWEYCTPIFSSVHQAAIYVARSVGPEPDASLGFGVRLYNGNIPHGHLVSVRALRQTSTPLSWLAGSESMLADYLDELGNPEWDDLGARIMWVEMEDNFEELMEDEVHFLLTTNFR